MARLPQLGLRLHGELSARECVERAKHVESVGFDSVWFAENPYERGVLPAAAACALSTQRIRIGIGVFNPYNRHPTLMAMEIGALDELADGRVCLGIGYGIGALNRIGPHERPLAAVRDTVQIVRPLLAGEEVAYQGTLFSANQVRLGYKPPRSDVPLYVAAMGEQALRLCGELGDGLIIGNMCPPDHTRFAVDRLRQGAAAAGREPPAHVVKYVPSSVHRDGRQARNAIRHTIATLLSRYWKSYEKSPNVRNTLSGRNNIDPDRFSAVMKKLEDGEPADAVIGDDFVAAYAVAGTPDECVDQLAYLGETGVTELAVSTVGEEPGTQERLLAAALSSARA